MDYIRQITFALSLAAAGTSFLWAASSDYRAYLIPNRACALAALAYLVAGAAMAPTPWLEGLGVGAVVLVLGAALFARGLMGGGDVKLAAAAALWAGPHYLSAFALAVGLTAALLSAVMLSPLRRLMPAAPKARGEGQGLAQPMPFGIPIAAGGALVLVLHAAARL